MPFLEYKKIYALGKEETEGVLGGTCYIQEKVDGANTQVWFEDGVFKTGSRSKEITEGFNGFCAYVQMNEPIKKLLTENPTWRLYMEWLVRHTIQYKETAYRKAYLFDIFDGEKMLETRQVNLIAHTYGIPHPQLFTVVENPTVDQINQYVGQTNLGEIGEGVVIKNPNFINKFGERQYAKIVTQKFKEDNALVFGGNNKHSDTYWEMYIVNKYLTLERVQKIMNKLQPVIDKKLDYEHTPRVASAAYHDMMTEEIWDIAKKVGTIDFKELNRLASRKAVQIYKDILSGDVSVADRDN